MATGREVLGDQKKPQPSAPATNLGRVEIASGGGKVPSFPSKLSTELMPDFVEFSFFDIVNGNNPNKFVSGRTVTKASKDKRETLTMENSATAQIDSTVKSVKNATVSAINWVDRGITVITDAMTSLGILSDEKPNDKAKQDISDVLVSAVNKIGSRAQYKHTGETVRLMMPSAVYFNDGANWQAFNSAPSMAGQLINFFAGDRKMDQIVHEASKLLSGFLYENGEQMSESLQGKTYNSYAGQFFQGMNRRQFRFEWLMTPKNMDEYKNIKRIVNIFRRNAHPSVDGLFMYYPSQVDIDFMTSKNGKPEPNEQLPMVASCVIKEVAVNYTPNNQWTTIDDPSISGAPYQTILTVTMEEVASLVKQDITKGY